MNAEEIPQGYLLVADCLKLLGAAAAWQSPGSKGHRPHREAGRPFVSVSPVLVYVHDE